MQSLVDAYSTLWGHIKPLAPTSLKLEDAIGTFLRQELASPSDYPTFDQSAMDGYALHENDLDAPESILRVIGQIQAGSSECVELKPGTALRVFTGAPLPPSVAAVRIQEEVIALPDGSIHLTSPTKTGANIRRAGTDISHGDLLFGCGDVLDTAATVVLSNLRVQHVVVCSSPRVLVLSSGDELVDLHGPKPLFGQVVDGNQVLLKQMLTQYGAQVVESIRVPDNLPAIERLVDRFTEFDLVVSCGGMSVGDFDLLGRVMRERAQVLVYKVAVKPGKPVLIAQVASTLIVGLPGNPVSAYVGSHLFLVPILKMMQGSKTPFPVTALGQLTTPIQASGSRLEFLRAHSEYDRFGTLLVTPMNKQGSNAISGTIGCDCLLVRPPNSPTIEAKASVYTLRFSDLNQGCSFERFAEWVWPHWLDGNLAKP